MTNPPMCTPVSRVTPVSESRRSAGRLSIRVTAFGVVVGIAVLGCANGRGAEEVDKDLADQIIREYYSGTDLRPNPALQTARKNPEAVKRILESSRPERERLAAYDLYVQSGSPAYERVILSAVKDSCERMRARAVHDLRKALSGKELVAQYVRLLDDPSCWVRFNAAEALVDHPSQEAIEPLLRLLADKSVETRHQAAWTLLMWKLPEARKRMQQLRHSRDCTVAGVANYELAVFGEERIDLSAIQTYLQQELDALAGPPYHGTDAVLGMIQVLRDRGDVTSLAVLQKARHHKHRSVRDAARKAIEEINKRSHPATEEGKRGGAPGATSVSPVPTRQS